MTEPKPSDSYHAGTCDPLAGLSPLAIYDVVLRLCEANRYAPLLATAFYLTARIAANLEGATNRLASIAEELVQLNVNGIPTLAGLSGELSDRAATEHTKAVSAEIASLQAIADRIGDLVELGQNASRHTPSF